MKKLATVLAAVILIIVFFVGIRHRHVARTSAPQAAPAPTMTDLNGKPLDLPSYAGKVVVINFWAAWCTPCREEIPQFIAMQDHEGERGLQIIGISMDDTETVLRKYYADTKMNYPVVIGNQKLAEAYGGVLGLPTTILIGRDQRVRDKLVGTTDFNILQHKIEALLQEHP